MINIGAFKQLMLDVRNQEGMCGCHDSGSFEDALQNTKCCGVSPNRGEDFAYIDNFKISIEDREGGSEGDGDYMHVVYRIEELLSGDVQFFKVEGCYSSWGEDFWHEPVEVFAKEVKVVTYMTKEEIEKWVNK